MTARARPVPSATREGSHASHGGQQQPGREPPAPVDPLHPRIAIRPRRSLLRVLAVVMAVWIVALVVLYVTTVYPRVSREGAWKENQPPTAVPRGRE